MSDQENQIIEPASFTRAEASRSKPLISLNPVTLLILALFLILAAAALFMFNARAVQFNVTPDAESVVISSGLPTYQLGERHLMLKGDYELTVNHPGYKTLVETISVGDAAEQTYTFALIPRPGVVQVQASFEGEPLTGASVQIDQVPLGITPLKVNEVEAGLRDLYVEHPRFLPFQTDIEVEGKRVEQTVDAALTPAWAMVAVSTNPAGANILVDGETAGATPDNIEVMQGSRTLTLKLPGYKSWETRLDIVAGMDQTLDEVVLIKSDGKLNITSVPTGVNITISGQYQGQTPLALALAPADHYELIATRAGYQSITRDLSIAPEEDQSLRLNLSPVVGLVKLNVSPPGGTLFVDGKALGDPNQTLELTARSHTIRVDQPGFASYESEVIPQPGFSQQLNIVMQTEEAARVSSIPQRITTAQGDIMRFIIPGKMKMGAGRREPGRRSNEIERDIELTRAYYLGEKEVSNQSFSEFDPGHDSGVLGRALLSEPDRPVVNVSWDKAVRYANWLSDQDGLTAAYEMNAGAWRLKQPTTTGYRLPTEAEWAWAARYADGNSPSRFPWGDNMPPTEGAGNFADESAANMVPYSIIDYNDSYRGPAPGGVFDANPLGIFDLAGNVSEWVHDYYSIELNRKVEVDPIGPDSGDYYVIRGSNYTHGRFSELRWTFRDYGSDARPDVGFRLARFLE